MVRTVYNLEPSYRLMFKFFILLDNLCEVSGFIELVVQKNWRNWEFSPVLIISNVSSSVFIFEKETRLAGIQLFELIGHCKNIPILIHSHNDQFSYTDIYTAKRKNMFKIQNFR